MDERVKILAHARSFIPLEMAGRGVTIINLIPGIGSSVLPMVTGPILSYASVLGAGTLVSYRVLFSFVALLLLAASLIYLLVPAVATMMAGGGEQPDP